MQIVKEGGLIDASVLGDVSSIAMCAGQGLTGCGAL